jgi:rhamnose utilization protein RhaD (predicted bifunctional aldolase and dehydrogenase)
MNEASLSQLIEVSRAVGTRPEFVQGGGGNTSVKSPGGATMAVKASGTSLAAMSEDAGWCEMDVARLLELFDRPYLGYRGVLKLVESMANTMSRVALERAARGENR